MAAVPQGHQECRKGSEVLRVPRNTERILSLKSGLRFLDMAPNVQATKEKSRQAKTHEIEMLLRARDRINGVKKQATE